MNAALASVLKGAYVTEGFTLPTLADASKINERTLQRIMSGLAPVTMGQLETIARAINRDPQRLFEDALMKADRDELSEAGRTTASLDKKRKERETATKPAVAPKEYKRVAKKPNPELGRDEPSPT